MPSHTPPPWRLCGGMTPGYNAIYADGHGYIVFEMADSKIHKENNLPITTPSNKAQQANAVLMTASPELFDALVNLVDAVHRSVDYDSGTRIGQALEKADEVILKVRHPDKT